MSDDQPREPGQQPSDGEADSEQPEPEWRRRRRLADVFGEVLPEGTSDDRDEREGTGSEEWLRRQVPPHHG